ncbi:hypothetical protein C8Q73DRAFT_718845 [Cubamyces lactineus]|nr:hypothetical protein C8Q73DRAFT_718845 [Cubamyces lactineus]
MVSQSETDPHEEIRGSAGKALEYALPNKQPQHAKLVREKGPGRELNPGPPPNAAKP